MDPVSFLGAVGAGAGIVATILKTIQKLSELRERFQEADTTIGLLITELVTIQAALVRIDGWAKYTFTPTSPIQGDLRSAFEVSLDGCGLAMNILAAEVESLANDRSDFSTRARTLLNETNMRIHQQRLHAQVGALQLLIQAVQVPSLPGQAALLREPKNRQIIERIRDDTSSLRTIAQSTHVGPESIITRTNSTVGSTVFPFDLEIMNSVPYRNNGAEAIGKREDQIAGAQARWDAAPNGFRQGGRSQARQLVPVLTSDGATVPRDKLSPNIEQLEQWQRPQPYEMSISSGASSPNGRNVQPLLRISPGLDSAQSNRGKPSEIKNWMPDLFKLRGRPSLSFSGQKLSPSTPSIPVGRRGRRRSENDLKRSIDLSSQGGFAVPPIVRAAQEGSMEIESLLDQGAKIEEVHAPTGRTALAVASHCGHDDIVKLLVAHGARTDVVDVTGMAPLHLAAARGHSEVVEHLLGEGVDVDSPGPAKKTPLRLASENGYDDVTELLLQHRAKVNTRDGKQLTALHAAAKQGDEPMVNLLLTNGADVEAKDRDFMSALHYAAENGHAGTVDILLKNKASIESCGKESKTALMCACSSGSPGSKDVVKLLIKKKASLKHKGDGDMMALHWASYNGHDEIVNLLQKRVPIDARTKDGRTPLHVAVLSRNFSTAELLMRRGGSVEAQCANSMRPLHYACEAGDVDLVQLLLSGNAELEAAATSLRRRPIHIATSNGFREVINLLLDRGASIDARDAAGERPLCLASANGNADLVQLLLDRGAAMRLKFFQGQYHEDSPLCLAAKYGQLSVVRELITRGASIRQKDEQGWQPLRYAAYFGWPDVVKTLLDGGASVSGLSQGSWGFSMSATRVGFAPNMNITEERKARVLSLMQTAEHQESSAQDAATPQATYATLQQHEPAEKDDDQDDVEEKTYSIPPPRPSRPWPYEPNSVASIAAIASALTQSPPEGLHLLAPNPEAGRSEDKPVPSPYTSYTTWPQIPNARDSSALARIRSDISTLSSSDSPYSKSTISPRPPSRPPPPPPSQTADDLADVEDLGRIRALRCDNCRIAGKPAPDLTCSECRTAVFRFSYNRTAEPMPQGSLIHEIGT